MTNSENSMSNRIYHSEISARRVSGLLRFFNAEKPDVVRGIVQRFLDEEGYQKILNDKNLWISQSLETKIISALAEVEDISATIYQIGKETLLSQTYDILPGDDTSIGLIEFLQRLPVLLSKLTRIVFLDIREVETQRVELEFFYRTGFSEKWYDVIFFKGMLDGLSLLYQISDFRSTLLATKLFGLHVFHRELGTDIEFGSNRNLYEISWASCSVKISRTKFQPVAETIQSKKIIISKNLSEEEDERLSLINLSQLIDQSRELALENRDLEAAVEILKSFKSELERKQRSMVKDLKLARDIQNGLLPQRIPDWNGIEFCTYFQPMQEVSGDYYDFFPMRDRIGLTICDVSGHGVPAALITALSKMLFSRYKNLNPTQMFKNINRDLINLLQYQGYTTSIYLSIEQNYTITYSIAGHPRPIVLRAKTGDVEILNGEGTFLGMFPTAGDLYENQKFRLEPGDKVFLYTDGVTEARDENGEDFGEQRFLDLVRSTRDLSIYEALDVISQTHSKFTMGTDQGDDITLLGFSLNPRWDEFFHNHRRGLLEFQSEKYSDAVQSFQSAFQILPRETTNLFALGKSLAKSGNYQESIRILREYNEFRIQGYESHSILGYCHFQLNEWELAEDEWKKAIYLDDSKEFLYLNLARLYSRKKEVKKYKEILVQGVKNCPESTLLPSLLSDLEQSKV
jgi:serine phosphatase RsbU (regulator of sigma subunit)